MIDIDRLKISFGATPVIRDLSLHIAPGESYGLVGESGSGKSTILRAIAGLVPFKKGHIAIAGAELEPGGPRDIDFLRKVQMVFQDPYGSFHPRHTVEAVLREGPTMQSFSDAEYRISLALDNVGLDDSYRRRFPHQLSGGQRQRVAIARAIITEPRVLLLDEPTSALDVSVQAEILNLLDDLRRQRGLTFIFVSHNLPVIAHMCDRVGVLRGGALVEELSKAELYVKTATHPYTQGLLEAAAGYRRKETIKGAMPTINDALEFTVTPAPARHVLDLLLDCPALFW